MVVIASFDAVTEHRYVAAWVPDDDPQRSWDDAADLAVEWLLREADRLGVAPLLVTPTKSQWTSGAESIRRLAQNYEATTPRSSRPTSGQRSVLVYVPDYDTFHLAANYAHGSSLAVVESVTTPLRGWAMEVAALNLLTGDRTPDTRTEEQRRELDRLHFYGNNGWTTGFGKDQATRLLSDLQRRGLLDTDVVLGYMLAKGHHGKAIDRLAKIIGKLG